MKHQERHASDHRRTLATKILASLTVTELRPPKLRAHRKKPLSHTSATVETGFASLVSTAQTGHANGADWQEETYQKIKTMKDLYLPEVSEMYQKVAAKLQQHDSLQIMLERFRTFLQVSKNNIPPDYKEKLGSYEKFIVNYINTNRSKMPAPQQGQLRAPHMQSVLSLENQINLQLQSMNLQDNSMSQQGQLRAPHMQSVLSLENQINLQLHSMNLQDNSMSD
ncbi:hypothetical protein RGQ29_020656 [Quercus rubra]|uniref:Uncharacterized protein n=1 Tax=Quercus rubra TaxID=3512 RepID=A0AAN7FH36_QUERU|nr:hypothetical protein RGQ29_020656 [Quercus rubra]